MSKYINRWCAPLVLVAALSAAACTDTKKTDTLAQDSSLNRDLQMANQDSTAQPALTDVPATSTPTTSAPATRAPVRTTTRPVVRTPTRTTPKPATPSTPTTTTTASGNTETRGTSGSERSVGTIPAGSEINLTSNSRVCTNTHKVGQRFSTTVSSAVQGSNGAVIPAGATATVEITELSRSENINDKINMGFRVVSVSFGGRTYAVSATTTYANVDRVKNQPKSKDIQKVVGGAAVGAVLGQVIGHDVKSTVIGAAAGAAAGTGAATATANYEGCVPEGGRITIRLDSSVQVQA
ncbi:MAG TPA: hypothetical protein VFC35_02240 [Gemmatimonadaceae bacterium]|nr:hypothetical protein [Gemmatimonadaceae bacterium]